MKQQAPGSLVERFRILTEVMGYRPRVDGVLVKRISDSVSSRVARPFYTASTHDRAGKQVGRAKEITWPSVIQHPTHDRRVSLTYALIEQAVAQAQPALER